MLHEHIVPAIRQLPGFRSGTWLPGNEAGLGLSLTIWESEMYAKEWLPTSVLIRAPSRCLSQTLRGARGRRNRKLTLCQDPLVPLPGGTGTLLGPQGAPIAGSVRHLKLRHRQHAVSVRPQESMNCSSRKLSTLNFDRRMQWRA